jgi:hypothetical protein
LRHVLLCITGLFGFAAHCQVRHFSLPADYAALTAASRLQADAFSFLQNPAALSNLQAVAVGFFAEQRYLVPGLANAGVSIGLPAKNEALGFALQYLGGPQAQRAAAMFGATQKLGKKAAIGVQLKYHTASAAGYAAENTLGYAAGAQLQLAPQVQLFLNGANLHSAWRSNNNTLQQAASLHFGVGYDISEAVFLTSIIEKASGIPAEVKAAFQYRIASKLLCRAGVGTGAGQFFLGCGYIMGSLRLDVFTAVHRQLGFSPGLQLLLTSKQLK